MRYTCAWLTLRRDEGLYINFHAGEANIMPNGMVPNTRNFDGFPNPKMVFAVQGSNLAQFISNLEVP